MKNLNILNKKISRNTNIDKIIDAINKRSKDVGFDTTEIRTDVIRSKNENGEGSIKIGSEDDNYSTIVEGNHLFTKNISARNGKLYIEGSSFKEGGIIKSIFIKSEAIKCNTGFVLPCLTQIEIDCIKEELNQGWLAYNKTYNRLEFYNGKKMINIIRQPDYTKDESGIVEHNDMKGIQGGHNGGNFHLSKIKYDYVNKINQNLGTNDNVKFNSIETNKIKNLNLSNYGNYYSSNLHTFTDSNNDEYLFIDSDGIKIFGNMESNTIITDKIIDKKNLTEIDLSSGFNLKFNKKQIIDINTMGIETKKINYQNNSLDLENFEDLKINSYKKISFNIDGKNILNLDKNGINIGQNIKFNNRILDQKDNFYENRINILSSGILEGISFKRIDDKLFEISEGKLMFNTGKEIITKHFPGCQQKIKISLNNVPEPYIGIDSNLNIINSGNIYKSYDIIPIFQYTKKKLLDNRIFIKDIFQRTNLVLSSLGKIKYSGNVINLKKRTKKILIVKEFGYIINNGFLIKLPFKQFDISNIISKMNNYLSIKILIKDNKVSIKTKSYDSIINLYRETIELIKEDDFYLEIMIIDKNIEIINRIISDKFGKIKDKLKLEYLFNL